jgi:hypothetical protein
MFEVGNPSHPPTPHLHTQVTTSSHILIRIVEIRIEVDKKVHKLAKDVISIGSKVSYNI